MADTVYRVPVYILLGTFLKSMAELLARQTNDIIKEIELELPNAPQERLTNSVILKQAIKESGLCVHLKFPPPETSAFPFQR
uniref:Uncharacterized protein n=1 Tax=Panagrolaimus sp. JU765 TaxID=591449 RepID=A0AC34QH56_9BILA